MAWAAVTVHGFGFRMIIVIWVAVIVHGPHLQMLICAANALTRASSGLANSGCLESYQRVEHTPIFRMCYLLSNKRETGLDKYFQARACMCLLQAQLYAHCEGRFP